MCFRLHSLYFEMDNLKYIIHSGMQNEKYILYRTIQNIFFNGKKMHRERCGTWVGRRWRVGERDVGLCRKKKMKHGEEGCGLEEEGEIWGKGVWWTGGGRRKWKKIK